MRITAGVKARAAPAPAATHALRADPGAVPGATGATEASPPAAHQKGRLLQEEAGPQPAPPPAPCPAPGLAPAPLHLLRRSSPAPVHPAPVLAPALLQQKASTETVCLYALEWTDDEDLSCRPQGQCDGCCQVCTNSKGFSGRSGESSFKVERWS